MTLILAIESSCDETACAVIRNGNEILSDIVSSQINTHTLFGGVVPEVASRIHVENISAVIFEALKTSGVTMEDIDAVAYTQGPGLIGSLHVGVMAAKTIAFAYDKPLIPVHHITGHIYANAFVSELKFPLLALVVSGGHTELVRMRNDYDFEVLGTTVDDAIGEAYDKVARVLELGYPGGPAIDKLAKEGRASPDYRLPVPKTDNPCNFSFSGLKTAVLQLNDRLKRNGKEVNKADLAYCFQETALGTLADKTIRAVKETEPKMLVLAGGVAANSRLREMMKERMAEIPDCELVIPPLKYCTDNAAMIGAVGHAAYLHQAFGSFEDAADPGLLMPGEA
ncbi:MAG: tRNA (adenosine(37)-N6)-threonylcarbamoyltransferase complex transferase subunit TsaD [Solobacterium sp.]|nr:tRNA (adenosine(37)-N6)-threonylcarbamoyltransferase complex transferase subunit TsaD [Solobacterium sp.]